MTTGRITVATADDVDAIVAVVEAAYRAASGRDGWTTESHLVRGARTSRVEVADTIASADACILVGRIAGRVIGCCRIERQGPDGVLFGLFAVLPEHQGAGLGGELLRTAMRIARGRFGATSLTLWVLEPRPELRGWYERLRFVDTGERLSLAAVTDGELALAPDLRFAVYRRALDDVRPAISVH